MAKIIITSEREETNGTWLDAAAVDDAGKRLSTGVFRICDSRYGNGYIKAMTAGGIGTPVEFRRGGNVRRMFETMLVEGKKHGAAVSILHPFSFGYYRKFGYEKVSDHLILRFPTRMIDFVPRHCSLTRVTDEKQRGDLCRIYEAFSLGRNLMIARHTPEMYSFDANTYIYYDGTTPAAYITFDTSNRFIVNHMGDSRLTVREIAFTTPQALREIFSFLRMFEGEMDEIEIANCAMIPEIDLLLRHYTHTSYTLVPDIMARAVNIPLLLSKNAYPTAAGRFALRVIDPLGLEQGAYQVSYGDGNGEVQPLGEDAEVDLTLDISAFTRIVYGYDGIDSRAASCIDGVTLHRASDDFFRAFPKKPCGVFEHF